MRKFRLLLFCALLFITLEMMTSIDAQNAADKKHKKLLKKDLTKDKSSNEDSSEEAMADVNPKLKPFQHRQTRKSKPEWRIRNDTIEIPNLAADNKNSTVQQAKTESPDSRQRFQTKLNGPPPQQNCAATVGNSDKFLEIERNVSSLWRHLNIVSQPVHVHVHGGHSSSPGCHRNTGCQGRCHGDRSRGGHHRSHKNPSDRLEYHGDTHNQSYNHSHDRSHHHFHHHHHHHHHRHSPHHASHTQQEGPRTQDSDKSRPHNLTTSHKHHSKSHSRSHNETGRGDCSHKSHHHSKHHSKSHSDTHHVHRLGDRSHKFHHHSKDHSYRYKSDKGYDYHRSKGHHHRRDHGFEDRSTHIHIHLTLDEKPFPVHQEINQSEPAVTTPVPGVAHEHTDPHISEPVFARCDFLNSNINNNLVGFVLLRQSSSGLDVSVNISGFRPQVDESNPRRPRLHGFHVHESGDFSKGCLSFGGHFNPEGTTHGGLTHDIRHVGDWGNIEVNEQGQAVTHFSVHDATLQGLNSILGRGIVIHEHEDDLGEGGVPASKTTGNAGGRMACCIIGHSKPLPEEAFLQKNDTSQTQTQTLA